MKNMLFVNTIRKIKDTHKKFISLMCMSLLGVGFFVGIKSSSPNMLDTINTYLKDSRIDYSNNLTKTTSNFSIKLNKYINEAISNTFNIFSRLVK